MILTNNNYVDGFAILRYKSTFANTWSDCLDLMQVFLDDIQYLIQVIQYIEKPGEPPIDVNRITDGLLHKTPEFQTERAGIVLAGHSEQMRSDIKIMMFTGMKTIDVQVILNNDYIIGLYKNSDHVLDVYMNSLELLAMKRKSIRDGIHLYRDFITNIKNENAVRDFMDFCDDINAKASN